jgi:hypothetical protein
MTTVTTKNYSTWRPLHLNTKLNIVQFSHFSVKEYLLSSRALSWGLDEQNAHVSILRTSIAYYLYAASLRDIHSHTQQQRMLNYSLLYYLVEYAPQHINLLRPREHPHLAESFRLFLDPMKGGRTYNLFCSLSNHSVRNISLFPTFALSIASRFGLPSLIKWLFSVHRLQSAINSTDPWLMMGPPIAEAALNGHSKVIRLLLEANPDISDGFALRIAAAKGHANVVAMLIQAGADLNSGALEAAIWIGSLEIVEMLLGAGAKVDSTAAIKMAVEGGYR